MRSIRLLIPTLGLLAALPGAAQDAQVVTPQADAVPPAEVVGYTAQTGSNHATLILQYADGATRRIMFRGGDVLVNGSVIGQYATGGTLERIWRELIGRDDLSTGQMLAALNQLPTEGLAEADLPALSALQSEAALPPAPSGVEVPPMPDLEGLSALDAEVAEARALARDLRNQVRSDVRTNIREGIRNGIQVTVPDGFATNAVPPISTVPGGLLALFGTLLAMSGLALGTSFFAERQLDVMADTVQKSLARSFFVGLFAQPLVLPALGALVVGLMLTIVGIIVIPFAVAGFFALLAVGLIGGYLAVARATGATFLERRGKAHSGGMNLVKSIVVGLAILLAIWLPAVLLGWVPVMGTILRIAAGIFTWGLVTTGFGAAILTRGGVRGTFGRRYAPAPVPFSHQLSVPDDHDDTPERFDTSEWLSGKAK